MPKTRTGLMDKLQFLDQANVEGTEEVVEEILGDTHIQEETVVESEQQVVTDNQEYYELNEVTIVGETQEPQTKSMIKIFPTEVKDEPPRKVIRKNGGRKKNIPAPRNIAPIKILPKPVLMNGPKLIQYVEDTVTPDQRSQTIDKLIEKVLKENTNEIDVFFRSMAASVKKLQPNLIPKVKMEVCNVIAKYEMQSFDRNMNNE